MNARLHRPLHGLALLAILLLAVVPTLGRFVAPGSGEAAASVAHRMGPHMPHGMAHATGTPAAPRHHHHQHDDDCAYCVLLGSAVPTVSQALSLPATPLPACVMPRWVALSHCALPRGRLGSRGPPAAA